VSSRSKKRLRLFIRAGEREKKREGLRDAASPARKKRDTKEGSAAPRLEECPHGKKKRQGKKETFFENTMSLPSEGLESVKVGIRTTKWPARETREGEEGEKFLSIGVGQGCLHPERRHCGAEQGGHLSLRMECRPPKG